MDHPLQATRFPRRSVPSDSGHRHEQSGAMAEEGRVCRKRRPGRLGQPRRRDLTGGDGSSPAGGGRCRNPAAAVRRLQCWAADHQPGVTYHRRANMDRATDSDADRLDPALSRQPDPDDGDWWAAWDDIGGEG
jgi:hypothetical protein